MAFDFRQYLVIGISSRALFDLEAENRIFEEQGLEAYSQYQLELVVLVSIPVRLK